VPNSLRERGKRFGRQFSRLGAAPVASRTAEAQVRIGPSQARRAASSPQPVGRFSRRHGGSAPGTPGKRRPLPPATWIFGLMPLVAILLEEGNLLTWLFGSLSGIVSKFLRLALWGWAAFVIARKLAAGRRTPASAVCLYALAITIPATFLLTGSSPRYSLSATTFIPLTIVTLSASVRPENRRALVLGLCATVVLHLCFIFLPPESFVRQKAQWVLAQRQYGAAFLGDEQAGSKLTGLYLYPTFSGAVCILGLHLFRFSRLPPWLKFPLVVGCVLGCLVTVTRSVYVGLVAGIVLPFFFGSATLHGVSARAVTRVIISGMVLIAAGIIAWYVMPASLRAGLQHRFTGENLAKGAEQRLRSQWGMVSGLQALLVSPVWGSSVPDSAQCLGAHGEELAPHNSVIYVGLKHGLPTMFLFGATIWLAFHGLVRFTKLTQGTRENETFLSLLCGFTGCLPILLLNPQYGPLLFWVAAGLGLSYGEYQAAVSRAQRTEYPNSLRARNPGNALLGTARVFPPAFSSPRLQRSQSVLRTRRGS